MYTALPVGFVTQVCNKSSAVDQPAWHPDLPNSCKNGLLISENLYLTVSYSCYVCSGAEPPGI